MTNIARINSAILAVLVKHARLMPEFAGLTTAELRARMNHLAVPLAYREAAAMEDAS